jgi:hypothetical protein
LNQATANILAIVAKWLKVSHSGPSAGLFPFGIPINYKKKKWRWEKRYKETW